MIFTICGKLFLHAPGSLALPGLVQGGHLSTGKIGRPIPLGAPNFLPFFIIFENSCEPTAPWGDGIGRKLDRSKGPYFDEVLTKFYPLTSSVYSRSSWSHELPPNGPPGSQKWSFCGTHLLFTGVFGGQTSSTYSPKGLTPVYFVNVTVFLGTPNSWGAIFRL